MPWGKDRIHAKARPGITIPATDGRRGAEAALVSRGTTGPDTHLPTIRLPSGLGQSNIADFRPKTDAFTEPLGNSPLETLASQKVRAHDPGGGGGEIRILFTGMPTKIFRMWGKKGIVGNFLHISNPTTEKKDRFLHWPKSRVIQSQKGGVGVSTTLDV